jgi:hypothetical protein
MSQDNVERVKHGAEASLDPDEALAAAGIAQ